jgi:hypothetical protein
MDEVNADLKFGGGPARPGPAALAANANGLTATAASGTIPKNILPGIRVFCTGPGYARTTLRIETND